MNENSFINIVRRISQAGMDNVFFGAVTEIDDYSENAEINIFGGKILAVNKSGEKLSVGDTVKGISDTCHNYITQRISADFKPFPQVFVMTQAEYDSLTEKKENCLYGIIQEEQ